MAADSQHEPAVAWNSSANVYLVVWTDKRNFSTASWDIYGTRVRGDTGGIVDPAGILIAGGSREQSFARVASNGSDWLVAWNEFVSAGSNYDIYGVRVTSAGTVGASFVIENDASTQLEPDLASVGPDYLVVWLDLRNDPARADVYGALVTSSGGKTPKGQICSWTVPDHSGKQRVRVASNGATEYLVVWYGSEDPSTVPYGFYGARLSSSGDMISCGLLSKSGIGTDDGGRWRVRATAGMSSGRRRAIFGDVTSIAILISKAPSR